MEELAALDDLLSKPEWAPVKSWVEHLAEVTRSRSPYVIRRLCTYARKMPTELLRWQEECLSSQDRRKQREVLRTVQEYLDSHEGTRSYKQRELADFQSFFDYHDLPLVRDRGYRVRGTRPQNVGKMRIGDLYAILTAAHVQQDYAMHSMIWTQFQSFSGPGEIHYINLHGAEQIVKQLRENVNPIRIDMLKMRKGNDKPWFTYVGTPAADALCEYFEKERGWPEPQDVIWRDKDGGTMTQKSYAYKFLALSRHVKAVPKAGKGRGIRYGKSPHELRDLARSLVHEAHSEQHDIEGKKLLFDAACPEFWMGHGIDPLKYNEFWKHNPEGVRRQYLIAEKYLNIISSPTETGEPTLEMAMKVFANRDLLEKALGILAGKEKAEGWPTLKQEARGETTK